MPITQSQRDRRKSHLGSSDAAAIVGLSPWRSPADVFLEKTSDLTPQSSAGDVADIGEFVENATLSWFSKETGLKIRRNQSRVHKNGIMAANLDALVADGEPAIIEAKSSGIMSPWGFNREQWGEAETDQVPEHIILQCQHQLAVCGDEYRTVWIPVLLGGIGFRKYRIDRNDQLIEQLVGMEVNFWNEYVLKRSPPPDSVPSFEVLKRIRREPSKTVAVADEIVREWQAAKNLEKVGREAKELAERTLLAALGDAEAGTSSAGEVTYFTQSRKSYVVPENAFRVLRFKKPKELANV